MTGEQQVYDAIKALLVASKVGDRVYDYDKVPGASSNTGSLPATFALLSVERRYAPPNNGRSAVTGWRVACRYVGTSAANARVMGGWISSALNETRVAIGGTTSTPITHESTTAVAKDDDGRQSGLSQWTFAISN